MNTVDIKSVAIIGAGLMGHGIAQVFACKNIQVALYDIKDEFLVKASQGIKSNLSLMDQNGLGTVQDIDAVIAKIVLTTDLSEAVCNADIVIEAIPENLEIKQKMFRDLDQLCPPSAILATNTSVISITEIAAKAQHRSRIIGTHFWNPPYLIPLVEVVRGKDTSDETIEIIYQFMRKVGKHPIKVMKDVPGFVANRLQHALWREAISIVEHGIADAATVDEAVKNSFAIRLPVLGPIENADMVGLDLTLSIHDYILKHIESSPFSSPLLKEKVDIGDLGFKTGNGFLHWPEVEAKKSREKLLKYLIDWTKHNKAK